MSKKRGKLIIIALLFLLALPLVSASEITTSSYSVDSFHHGNAGNNFSTGNNFARSTTTYEQGSNKDATTPSYEFNSGWFNITVTTETLGNATINSVECSNDTINYYSCANMSYQNNITHIRVNCTADNGNVADVRYTLFNSPDNTNYIDNVSYTYQNGDYYILNSSYLIQDSGDWNLTITCYGSENDVDSAFWQLAWGWLDITLIQPAIDTSVQIYRFFTFQSRVECVGGECGTVEVTLDPKHCEDITACTNETITECINATEEICTDNCTQECTPQCNNQTVQNCTETIEEVCKTESVCETWDFILLEDEYVLGEPVDFFILPGDSEYSIIITYPNGSITTTSEERMFPGQLGEYTVEAAISLNNTTRTFNETFSIVKLSGTTYTQGQTIQEESKELGEKIEDEPEYETRFLKIEQSPTKLTVIFYHDYEGTLPVRIEGNASYNLSKTTAGYAENVTLTVDLIDGIIPRFELHVGEESEVFQFGKIIPTVSIEDGTYELKDRDDAKLDIDISKDNTKIEIDGIENQAAITAKIGITNHTNISTVVASVQTIDIEQATITLEKTGSVNTILQCEDADFNHTTMKCSNWQETGIAFTENNSTISFTVIHFTAYAGGNLSSNETGYLIIWDENDPGMPNASQTRVAGQDIKFFADYKASQNGTKITDASCSITFSDSIAANMNYDGTYTYFIYNRSFANASAYSYSVSCTHEEYSDLAATDSIPVANALVKSGAVSTTTGDTPFYTTSNNPQTCSILRGGENCTTTWLVNATGILNTIHEFFVLYNMTSNTVYVNDNESEHINITITANDSQAPSILSTTALPTIIYLGQSVNLYSTASDNTQISSCWANITQPDSTIVQLNNTCAMQQSFTPTQTGMHNITFSVNDSSGNTAFNADDYFIVANAFDFSLTTNESNGSLETEFTLIYPETDEIIHVNDTNGSYTVTLPQEIFNLLFKAFTDKLQVTLRNVNITKDNNKTFGMDRLAVAADTSADNDLATYGVSNNYTFTNATIIIYYDNLAYSNEANLKLYKCDNWDFTNQQCLGSWTDVTSSSTQNTASDYFEYITTSFSGFSIGETIAAAEDSGGSSGGGGSRSHMSIYVTKDCTDKPVSLLIKFLKERSMHSAGVSLFKGNTTAKNKRVQHYFLRKSGFADSLEMDMNITENGTYTILVESSGYYDEKTVFDLEDCIKEVEIMIEPEENETMQEEEMPKPDLPEEEQEEEKEDVPATPAKPECELLGYNYGRYFLCWYWWIAVASGSVIFILLSATLSRHFKKKSAKGKQQNSLSRRGAKTTSKQH